jgi:hypothetical protein
VLAFSRVLSDQEVVVVANTATQAGWTGEVIVDFSLNPTRAAYRILFSNQAQPVTPGAVEEKAAGSIEVTDVDGNTTHGPVRVLGVNLQPMEIQILGRVKKTFQISLTYMDISW